MNKIGIIFAAILVTIVVTVYIAPSLISWEDYKDEIIQTVKDKTGRELRIRGVVSATFLPYPTIFAEEVELYNLEDAAKPYMAKVGSLEASLALGALLSGSIQLSEMTLVNPVIELETLPDGRNNWDFSSAEGKGENAEKKERGLPVNTFAIENGEITYRNNQTYEVYEFENVNGLIEAESVNGPFEVEGRFDYLERTITFEGRFGKLGDGGQVPLTVALGIPGMELQVEGRLEDHGQKSQLEGTMRLVSENLRKTLNAFGITDAPADSPAYPLQIQGAVSGNSDKFTVSDMKIQAGDSTAKSSLVAVPGKRLRMAMNFSAEAFDLDRFLALFESAEEGQESVKQVVEPLDGFRIPKTLQMAIKAQIGQLKVKEDTVRNLNFSGELSDGELIIHQGAAVVPGDTSVMIFGILGEYRGEPRFEGSMEAEGKRFRDILSWQGVDVSGVPAERLQAFTLSGNMLMTGNEARLTDLKFALDEIKMSGAALVRMRQLPEIEATGLVNAINFDAYFPPQEAPQNQNNGDGFGDAPYDVSWLETVPFKIDLNTAIDEFRFQENLYKRARFKLHAEPYKISASEISIKTEIATVTGKAGLESRQGRPLVTGKLHLDELKTWELSKEGNKQKPASAPGEWSREKFRLYALRRFDAALELSVDAFHHQDYIINDLAAAFTLNEGELEIKGLTGRIFGGTLDMNGRLGIHTIPVVSGSYVFSGLDLSKAAPVAIGIEDISGALSLSGSFSSSGVDMHQMVSNLDGNYTLSARQVTVAGLDLKALAHRVRNIRGVPDVINLTRLASEGGTTLFGAIDGTVYITKGIMETPGITLASEVGYGMLSGTVNLPDWVMDLLIRFQLQVGNAKDTPPLGVTLRGPVSEPERKLDTSGLEEWVAEKAAEKLLQQIPKFD